jgi:hypothetical protein
MEEHMDKVADRLNQLADAIELRKAPLGNDFSTECWGAVAKDFALGRGAEPCDYFGFSDDVYQAAIRVNRALPVSQRNDVMLGFTRALATAGPASA